MKRFVRIAAAAAALGLTAPVFAAQDGNAGAQPAKLSDAQLDQVSGGDGSLLNVPIDVNVLLKDIAVTVNISNVPVNVGAAVQANALGQAIQNATVVAGQQVTQAQYVLPLGH